MNLKTYVEFNNLEKAKFAKALGISPSALSNYLAGKRIPKLWVAFEIIRLTEGKVTLEELRTYPLSLKKIKNMNEKFAPIASRSYR